jgi:hypothetical protein
VHLVIRDKNVVEEVAIPREAILRAMFNEKPSSQPLTERLVELVDTSPSTHRSSAKANKSKAKSKSKTKKAPKKPKRKTVKRSRKPKQQNKKSRGKKLKMVCRME